MSEYRIVLGPDIECFVERSVRAGRFSDLSEMVHAGLGALLERDEAAHREVLRAAATAGFDALIQDNDVELGDEEALVAHIAAIGRDARARADRPAG